MSNAPETHDEDRAYTECDGAVDLIIEPRVKDLGDGFKVRRILPFHKRRMVGPFVFFDHFGPVEYAPGKGMDVRPHPHIGLATVTYLFDGAIGHKDSLGTDAVIRPGAVNWMTAGRGIVHSERTPPKERASGQKLHGLQTWVALPDSHAEMAPAFDHLPAEALPEFELGGGTARLLAGEAFGYKADVPFPWGIVFLAVDAPEGSEFEITADIADEIAIYVAEGEAKVDTETVQDGAMAVLNSGCAATVKAAPGSKLAIAGGQTMDGPKKIEWNLVSSDMERIAKAKADWRASIKAGFQGSYFSLPPSEHEWIPLPEDQ